MNDTLIQGGARGPALPAWLQQGLSGIGVRAFRIAGGLMLIAGLQTWGFYSHYVPALDDANGYLDQLMNEISTNTQMDVVLRELDNFRQVAGDTGLQKEVVVVYERFIKEFLESRLPALDQFEKSVASFKTPAAPLGAESLERVRLNLQKVMQIYADHYNALAEDYNSPPLYLQPTAAFIKRNNPLGTKIRFNQAAYNSIVGDVAAANTTFNELKQEVEDPLFLATIHFTQARMQYSAFKIEGKFDYFQQAIQNLQQSLRLNPDYGLAKMLLEYMLSVEGSASTQNSSVQGDGSGEAEGERGVISSEMPNF